MEASILISRETHQALQDLTELMDQSILDVVARSVEAYRRDHLLGELNSAYAALRADEKVWSEELAERVIWDGTLADGLEAS
jgi:hypothetical protein